MKNKPSYTKSIPPCSRTFKSWLWETRVLARKLGADISSPNLYQLKLYHDGGYSPKVVVGIELNIDL